MFCKYCGRELKKDARFCAYCGRDQKASQAETEFFGSWAFLLLTMLLTIYFPLHLAGSGSVLTFLLTIPTIVICIGCWIAFCEARRKQTAGIGLSTVRISLMIQVAAFLTAGVIWALLSAISFVRFLRINIDINLLNIHTSVGGIFLQYFGSVFALLVAACALLAAYGVILNLMLNSLRRDIRVQKNAVPDMRKVQWVPVHASRTVVLLVLTAAGSFVKLFLSSGIYSLFYFLLYPGQALANGIFTGLFGADTGQQADQVMSNIISAWQTWSGRGSSSMNAVKDFFLASLRTSKMETAAAVLFCLVLVLVIVMLIQGRKNSENSKTEK